MKRSRFIQIAGTARHTHRDSFKLSESPQWLREIPHLAHKTVA